MTMESSDQYCTFFVAGYYFGVEVVKVQEVFKYQKMTTVPRATSVIRGLINLRGQIVTALDLRHRLELEPRDEGNVPMNVVIRSNDEVTSLLVDEIGDVVTVTDEAFEDSPETLHGIGRELIRGVYKLDGRLLLILDVEKAMDVNVAA